MLEGYSTTITPSTMPPPSPMRHSPVSSPQRQRPVKTRNLALKWHESSQFLPKCGKKHLHVCEYTKKRMNRVSISDRNDASCLVTLIDDMRGGMAPYIPMAPGPISGHQFDRHCTGNSIGGFLTSVSIQICFSSLISLSRLFFTSKFEDPGRIHTKRSSRYRYLLPIVRTGPRPPSTLTLTWSTRNRSLHTTKLTKETLFLKTRDCQNLN